MGVKSQKRTWARGGLWLVLALVALALKVATPPGFMLAPATTGPALVICTGHGPAIGLDGVNAPGHPAKTPGKTADTPCPFAAAATTAPPPALKAFVLWRPARIIAPARWETDQSPGRGMAAPPPPSQGPPRSRV